MSPAPAEAGSLHDRLLAGGITLTRTQVSKPAMVEASHLLEDLVLAAGDDDDVVCVSCFQHERAWRAQRERYARLAERARVVAVHTAGSPAVSQPTPGPVRVATVAPEHPFAGEWFVVLLGATLSVTLCGRDLTGVPTPHVPEPARRFDVLVSTDPAVTADALRHVGGELGLSAGDLVPSRVPAPAGQDARLLAGMLRRLDAFRQAEAVARQASARLHEQAASASEHERRRLAETLHDDSLQYLLAAQQDLQEAGDDALAAARENLAQGVRNLRRTLRPLYLSSQETADLGPRVEQLAEAYRRRHGRAVDVTVDPSAAGSMDDHVAALVRELLTNAGKHAAAEHVTIVVGRTERGEVLVEVSDDGVGMDPERLRVAPSTGHIGLALAAERVAGLGGTWRVDTAPGRGTSVRITLWAETAG
jgi:signal transduction histidine kinase